MRKKENEKDMITDRTQNQELDFDQLLREFEYQRKERQRKGKSKRKKYKRG